jgi:integrase
VTLYQRGKIWWYEFEFRGQRIRESAHSRNKGIAERIERERRRQLELGVAGLEEVKRPSLFSVAMKAYLAERKPHWAEKTNVLQEISYRHLEPHLSRLLVTDVKGEHISRYQQAKLKEGASPRSINIDIALVRQLLKKHRRWANIQPDVKMLRERSDIGRALSKDEEHRLLAACKKSHSRSLYPAVLLSLHTGLRNGELRLLQWRQIDLIEKQIAVGKSKTAGGEGRIIPLSETAFAVITDWRRQFPDASPAHYVFPTERYGLAGEDGYLEGKMAAYNTDPTKPIGSWKVAWTAVRTVAKVDCRWHDMRHTFVSRMAESHASDATIMALAGHLSRKMMERYSHTRVEAKRSAIAVLDRQQALRDAQ